MAALDIDQMAQMIVRNPELRATYFQNPGKALAQVVPRRGALGRISPSAPRETTELREQLALAVEDQMRGDVNNARLISLREAYVESRLFLDQAMRNPQRTFEAVFWMSLATFVIGVAFVVGAFAAAWLGEDTTQKAVMGGLAGGAGLVATLGTVLATARDAIRKINGDNAQIRLILTDFATEMTHLRAISIDSFEDARDRNAELRNVMKEAVAQIERFVEPKAKGTQEPNGRQATPQEQQAGQGSAR